jgi:hypothetical protein
VIALRTTPRVDRVTIFAADGTSLLSFVHRGPEPTPISVPALTREALAGLLGMPSIDLCSSWPLPAERGDKPEVERRAVVVFTAPRDSRGVPRIDRSTEHRLEAVIEHQRGAA